MNKPFLSTASDNINRSSEINSSVYTIQRRGIHSGWIDTGQSTASDPIEGSLSDYRECWLANHAIHLPQFLSDSLGNYTSYIEDSEKLYLTALQGGEIDIAMDQPHYLKRFGDKFEILSTRVDEADRQELVSVDFDVLENGELALEDIWMRVSWLSFLEEEKSLRFRFSFGMEGFDDVSLDLERQLAAAELCDRVFPESSIICENTPLNTLVKSLANITSFKYLERIVYYNAHQGGAQFHHDAEKGNLGVVYAQLTGQTLWFAISKKQLIVEIQQFIAKEVNKKELETVVKKESGYEQILKAETDSELLNSLLDDPSNEEISELLNESPLFFAQLMKTPYVFHLQAGDLILLPQESQKNCTWHSVFSLGDSPGQALSFAIKEC